MSRIFGTDGVRGIANVYPMTTELAMQIGRGIAYLFKGSHKRPKVVIGKDTRLSGYMLENAIASGICSMGVDILLVGPLPTAGIAFITWSMRADAGIVISASHNPFQDNGIKIFSRDGFKLPRNLERKIEELVSTNGIDHLRPTAEEIGKATRIDDACGRYIVYLKNTFPKDLTLEGLTIVVDCANGAAYKVAPAVFEELGANLILTGVDPNGENINDGCGSLHPQVISNLVKENNADVGMAFDGDADRVILADDEGEILDGDYIMAICGIYMLRHGTLNKDTLVTTVMSNLGLEIAIRRNGGQVERTAVGDRHVVERMIEGGFNLGGEQSGHLVFLDHATTGDGILSALQVLAVMMREIKPLSELKQVMKKYPQRLVNIGVREKKPIEEFPEIKAKEKQISEKLGDTGRILIRPSGTEPLIRVMIEGQDEGLIDQLCNEMAGTVKKCYGNPL